MSDGPFELDSISSTMNKARLSFRPIRPASLAKLLYVLWTYLDLAKVALFISSLFLFILAINLMKEGAWYAAFPPYL